MTTDLYIYNLLYNITLSKISLFFSIIIAKKKTSFEKST